MVANEQSVVIPAAEPKGLLGQIRSFGRAFWAVNVMELIERWAYYGVRTVLSIYIVDAVARGGLEFTHIQKGTIYAWWAVIQSLLPLFTGGFADRYGYKSTVAFSIGIKILGYLLMATQHSFVGFFIGCMMLATGTAVFKPGVQGILANTTMPKNAAVGWGIFYAMVNIGGFIGPIAAGHLRVLDWSYVFYVNAALVAVNFLVLLMFKEPERPPLKTQSEVEGAGAVSMAPLATFMVQSKPFNLTVGIAAVWAAIQAFSGGTPTATLVFMAVMVALRALYRIGYNALPRPVKDNIDIVTVSVTNVFEPKLATFLVIFSGFWLMFMQLFDLLPNFIDDWVDTNALLLWMGQTFHNPTWVAEAQKGVHILPEHMVNIDAGAIVFLMVPIAALFSRMKAMHSMIVGILISIGGIVLAGATMNGLYCALGIFIFALGEMMASPKKQEYLANIAPPDKKGLYMGYANVPLAIGWGIGSSIGGYMYQNFADKVTLAKAYMASQLHMSPEAIAAIPKEKVMETLATQLNKTPLEVTQLLFALHHPERIWYIFGAIGLASMIGLIVYDVVLTRAAKAKGEPANA